MTQLVRFDSSLSFLYTAVENTKVLRHHPGLERHDTDDSPKCSLQSAANGFFPEGCFVDIDDVVTRNSFREDSEEPQSVMTAVNVGNSNSTDFSLCFSSWQL